MLLPRTLAVFLTVVAVLDAQGILKIYHIDVGQGSATLIQAPGGQSCLIDGGETGKGTTAVIPLLQSLGITQLQTIILTHYHLDHWGGLPEVMAVYPPQKVYDRGAQSVTASLGPYLTAIATTGAQRLTLTPGTVLLLGGGVTLRCVVGNGQVVGGAVVPVSGSGQEENSRSLGFRLSYGNYQESITGDLTGGGGGTANVEGPAATAVGDVDVMVVNHHGSTTSTNAAWLAALRPEVSVVSCGANNPYGHPAAAVVNAILAAPDTAAFYRLNQGSSAPGGTVVNGTLRIETDGLAYAVSGGSVAPVTYPADEGGPPPRLLPGDVVVSEVLADPAAVPDSAGEWIEVCNTTGATIDLGGITIRDHGSEAFVLPVLLLPARGYLVLARNGNPAQNGGVTAGYVWPSNAFSLGNTADAVDLVEPSGTVLDSVAWGSGSAIPVPSGSSVERRDLTALPLAANFGQGQVVFGAGDRGTPGARNTLDTTGPWTALTAAGPLTPGSLVTLTVNGGALLANRSFILGASESAAPGFVLPASSRVLDLGWGPLLLFSLAPGNGIFNGFSGTLNSFGLATAGIALPPDPALRCFELRLSGIVLDASAADGVAAVIDNLRLVLR